MLGHPSRMLVLAVLSMTIGSGHSLFDPQGKWTHRSVNWFKINWNRDKMLRITDITRGIYHPVITLLLSYSRNTSKKNSINRPFANSFSRNLTSTSHFPVLSTRFSRIRNIHDLIHFLFCKINFSVFYMSTLTLRIPIKVFVSIVLCSIDMFLFWKTMWGKKRKETVVYYRMCNLPSALSWIRCLLIYFCSL